MRANWTRFFQSFVFSFSTSLAFHQQKPETLWTIVNALLLWTIVKNSTLVANNCENSTDKTRLICECCGLVKSQIGQNMGGYSKIVDAFQVLFVRTLLCQNKANVFFFQQQIQEKCTFFFFCDHWMMFWVSSVSFYWVKSFLGAEMFSHLVWGSKTWKDICTKVKKWSSNRSVFAHIWCLGPRHTLGSNFGQQITIKVCSTIWFCLFLTSFEVFVYFLTSFEVFVSHNEVWSICFSQQVWSIVTHPTTKLKCCDSSKKEVNVLQCFFSFHSDVDKSSFCFPCLFPGLAIRVSNRCSRDFHVWWCSTDREMVKMASFHLGSNVHRVGKLKSTSPRNETKTSTSCHVSGTHWQSGQSGWFY